VRAYALVDVGDTKSVDLFLREADARRALADILIDEPEWTGLFCSTSSPWSSTTGTFRRIRCAGSREQRLCSRWPPVVAPAGTSRLTPAVYRVDHVIDGDTIALRTGQHVRLVQIDTPEVFFGAECYGRGASRRTKRLLPVGSRVRLFAEPATDRVDQYGRLLRYVVRLNGAVNINIRLVAVGAAAPYFYLGRTWAATRIGSSSWRS
jgi:endonuclease YncB( thermonuclease family)